MLKRKDIIIPLVKAKSVLHIGAAGTNFDNKMIENDQWLHKTIIEHANKSVVLDINESACDLLNKSGHRAICANAEDFAIDDMFDVIAVPEVLEHLSNPGKALDCFRNHLIDNGKLIVSVPNSYCFANQIRWQILGKELVHPEHVCWYSKKTVTNLLKRHGFQIKDIYYCPMYPPGGHNWKTYLKTIPLILRASWRESIVLICTISDS